MAKTRTKRVSGRTRRSKNRKRKNRIQHQDPPPASLTTAIVKVEQPQALQQTRTFSMAPKVLEAVRDMEQVRRFIQTALNIDWRRERDKILAKMAQENPPRTKFNEEEIAKLADLETDWGTIPGNDKPFLKQPGAEKFLLWLNLRPRYHKTVIELGEGHMEMACYVTLETKQGKEEVFEGPECSCSTMETNFRYVWGWADYQPSDEEVDRLKRIKMGQWRWRKHYKRGKLAEEGWEWQIRVDNPNIHNERNKVRQQGEKRAAVKCVRNMGALSEIFAAGPDEWGVGPEEDTTQTRDDDVDYTDSGRKIFFDGVTPSGRSKSPEKIQEEKREAAQKAGQDALRETQAAMGQQQQTQQQDPPRDDNRQRLPDGAVIILDWQISETEPVLRGLVTDKIISELQFVCEIYRKDDWYRIQPRRVEALKDFCKVNGIKLEQLLPKADTAPQKSSPPAPAASDRKGEEGREGSTEGRGRSGTKRTQAEPPPPSSEVSGTIERVTNKVINCKGKNGPTSKTLYTITILIGASAKKHDFGCWDKDMGEILYKRMGQLCKVIVEQRGDYLNITALRQVGSQKYEDVKTPVMDVNREPGLYRS